MKKYFNLAKIASLGLSLIIVLVTGIAVTFFIIPALVFAAYVGPTQEPPLGNVPGVIYNSITQQPSANINIDGSVTALDLNATSNICFDGADCKRSWAEVVGGSQGLWFEENPGSGFGSIFYNPDGIYSQTGVRVRVNDTLNTSDIRSFSNNEGLAFISLFSNIIGPGNRETRITWGDDATVGIPLIFSFDHFQGTDQDIDVMTLLSNGNVGIGTSNPSAPLDIAVTSETAIEFDNGESIITIHDGFGNFNFKSGVDDDNIILGGTGGSHISLAQTGQIQLLIDESTANGGSFTTDVGLILDAGEVRVISADFEVDTDTLFVDASADSVGIGKTNPTAPLDVVGQIKSSDTDGTGWASIEDTIMRFFPGDSNNFAFHNNKAGGNILFETGLFDIDGDGDWDAFPGWTPSMVITAAGDVGIGTASPDAEFQVESGAVIFGDADGINQNLRFVGDSGSISYIQTGYGSSDIDADLTISRYLTNSTNISDFNIFANKTYFSGNVGIGTASPAKQLHLTGDIRIDGGDIFFGATQKIRGDGSSAVYFDSNHDTISQIILRDKQNLLLGRLYGSSNTDGTVKNIGLLDADGNWSYLAQNDNYTAFRINNDEKMRIFSSGVVCIGGSANCDSNWPLLQVVGSAPAVGGSGTQILMLVKNTADDYFAGYRLESGTSAGAIGVNSQNRSVNPGDMFLSNNTSGGDINFWTSGTQKGTITSDGSFAIGNNAQTTGPNSVAIGSGAKAQSNNSYAIGGNALAKTTSCPDDSPCLASAYAFGWNSKSTGALSTALHGGVASGDRSLAIGYSAAALADNSIHISMGGDAGFFTVQPNTMIITGGRVGINKASPVWLLDLPDIPFSDTGRARANRWDTYSDIRVKTNQQPLEYGLEEVLALEPRRYIHHVSEFRDGELILKNGINTIGLIAQEVNDVVPEVVSIPADESEDLWSMSYEQLIPVLINAIKEQQEQIDELRLEITELKK